MKTLVGEVLTSPKMIGSVSVVKSLSGNVGAKTISVGEDGATFIPSVSEDGVISWTNDKELSNPQPVNIKGSKGDDGVSPIVTVEEIAGGHRVTITDKDGSKAFDVMDGVDGGGGDGGTSVPSDWLAAPGESGHVLNRTHYDEIVVEGGTIFPAADVKFNTSMAMLTGLNTDDVVSGGEYIVSWNGTTYKCTAFLLSEADPYSLVIGNGYLLGGNVDTGEPFCLSDIGSFVCAITKTNSAPETVRIQVDAVRKVVTHKLDPRFLPDGIGGGEQADLNAAEGEPGHVLNRTHWVEHVEVLPETSLTLNAGEDYFLLSDNLNLIIGREYTVKWNGVEYTCTATAVEDANELLFVALGNLAESDFPAVASDEPFLIAEAAADDSFLEIHPLDDSTSLTISIRENIVRKLDNKYLDMDWIPSKVGRVILEEQTVENGRLEAIDAQYRVNGTPIIVYVNGVPHETKIVVEGYECYANFTAMDSVSIHGEVSLVFNDLATVIYLTNLNGQNVKICLAEYEKIPQEYLPDNNAVQYTEQTLTEEQKAQARQNIGAAAVGDSGGSGGVTSWNDLPGKPFGSEFVDILPETTVDIDSDAGFGVIPAELALEVGKEYAIMYNGVEYRVSNGMEFGGQFYIGNIGVLAEGLPITEEPFVIVYSIIGEDDAGNSLYGWAIVPLDGSASVTLSIRGEVVTQIPDKYIPSRACVIDVDIGSHRSFFIDIDTTELVDALLYDLPIYVNIKKEYMKDNIIERLQAWPTTSTVVLLDVDIANIKDYVNFMLASGAEKSNFPIVLNALTVDGTAVEIITININTNET